MLHKLHMFSLLFPVKRQFQLQLSGVFPLFSKDDKISQLEVMLSSLTVHTDTPDLLFKPSEVENVRQELLQYWWWFDSSFLQPVILTLLDGEDVENLSIFESSRSSSLGHVSVDKCFPQPLTDLPPLPGYTPMRLHLPHPPAKITMDELWELKKTICSSLHLHSHALLLKGYMRGSTDVIFYLATTAKVPPERVCQLMMSSDVIIHNVVFGCGTSHEVSVPPHPPPPPPSVVIGCLSHPLLLWSLAVHPTPSPCGVWLSTPPPPPVVIGCPPHPLPLWSLVVHPTPSPCGNWLSTPTPSPCGHALFDIGILYPSGGVHFKGISV